MARGDQIYVMRPLLGLDSAYEHHGIDCGDGTVIHYSKAEGEPTIRRTTLADFSWNNSVYLKQQPVCFVPEVVVERAESRLGEQRYDLMSNNCEHFANWCKTGRNESMQLNNYGLGTGGVSLSTSRRLMGEATASDDPVRALHQFREALENVAIARRQFQDQLLQSQKDASTWHRVAQRALQQGKEAIARAALERKVAAKEKTAEAQSQLDVLAQLETDLQHNSTILQQRTDLILQ